ncbi:MAG: hypothetical protein IJ666_05240 [Ruminococcus sp.]|nr:hypothetical protein [Ruminococcus sp.]
MKTRFNILTAFVCALSVCTAIPMNASAESADEKYREIIENVPDVSGKATDYGFFDLDGDGSDELIVSRESTSSISYAWRVYTIKNSDVEEVAFRISSLDDYEIRDTDICTGTVMSIDPSSGIIKIDASGEWDNHVIYCQYADTYKGAVISETDRIDYTPGGRTSDDEYLHNGKKAEKSEYLSVQRSYGDSRGKAFVQLGLDYKISDWSPFETAVTTSKTEKSRETTSLSETVKTAAVPETVTTTEKVKQFDSSEIFMSWKEAYSAVLRYFEDTSEYSADTSAWDLYDINGDEIPELFISPKSTQDSGVYIYTFENNRCQKLSFPDNKIQSQTAGSWGVVSVIPDKNLLRSYTLKDCVEKNIYYSFSGRAFKSDFVFASNSIDGQYYCNDMEVTPEDYFLSIKPYENMTEYTVGRKYSFKDISVSFEAYVSAQDKKNVQPETEPPVIEEEEKISPFKAHLPKFLAVGALIAAGAAVLIPFMKSKKAQKKKSSK